VNYLPAAVRKRRCPFPAITAVVASLDESLVFELRKLTANRRVVPSHVIGDFRDAQRASCIEDDEQRKQCAINNDAGFAEQRVIALGAIQKTHEVNERRHQLVQITCILHLYIAYEWVHIRCMIHASRILVIGGSIRPRRVSADIAEWVAKVGREATEGLLEVVDLKDWPLPMDDEPGIPAGGEYAFEHTRAWSRKVSEGDAFVFVTPQYNWGYPAPLKNALDHLYSEWSGKPAMIVTYGGRGGGKCADQLRQVLDGLHMKPVATMPSFILSRERIEDNTGIIEPTVDFAEHLGALQQGFGELVAALAMR
jgi:NAD(P)H-dependent FMN reductase